MQYAFADMTTTRSTANFAAFTDNAIPLYRQIADLLRQRLAKGRWHVGDQFLTLDALMAEFGVARVTARQTIALLTQDGLVSSQRGRGTFVTALPPPRPRLNVQVSLETLALGYKDTKPLLIVCETTDVHAPVRKEDGAAAERYVYMKRVHTEDAKPYCVIDIYLDASIFAKCSRQFRSQPVIPLLAGGELCTIAKAHQALTIDSADMEVARHLNIPVNAPVAHVRRVFCDADGRVIYIGEVTYRGDFIHIDMDLLPTQQEPI